MKGGNGAEGEEGGLDQLRLLRPFLVLPSPSFD